MKRILQVISRHMGALAAAFGFLFLAAGFLLYPKQVQKAVYDSAMSCFQLLIPSLFPFIALTSFAVHSSAGQGINFLLSFITEKIFRLPRVCGTALFMGLIGGYPAGAAGISALYNSGSITRDEAARMLSFCINPGVAFVIGFLGGTVLQNAKAGLLLFCAVLLSSVLLGILTGLGKKANFEKAENRPTQPVGAAIIFAAQDASRGILKMCACILLFSAFTAVLESTGLLSAIARQGAALGSFTPVQSNAFLKLLLEITSGVLAGAKSHIPAVLYAFALAFGGISVHLQVFSFFKEFPMHVLRFFIFRIFHGGFSLCIFLFLLRMFPTTTTVFFSTAPQSEITGTLTMSPAGGISLLLMCIVFLLLCVLPGTIFLRRQKRTGQSKSPCAIINDKGKENTGEV